MSQSQSGKVVVITGGNSGMGYSTAKLFASEGAKVFITGRDEKTLKQALLELGPDAQGMVSNAGSLKDITVLAETLKQKYSQIDTLFLNAGVAQFASFESSTEEQYTAMFDTNVKGPFFLIQKVLPLLKPGASVVLNASVVAHIGLPDVSIYSATKAAVKNLVKTLSTELIGRGIRVNAVSPGPISTPIFGRNGASDAEVNETKKHMSALVPMGRIGEPEEIAKTVFFLGTNASSFIAGSEIVVDGGFIKH